MRSGSLAPLVIAVLAQNTGCADKNDEPAHDTSYCGTSPTVTWGTWGQGFVTENCQSCHAATSPDRNGAPEDIHFDTEEEVAAAADLMLAVATGDAPSMPPEGGITDDDRALLTIWLTCGID